MASIIMKRGIASEIRNTPISDGQILFERDTKNIYIDEGSNRTKYRALTVDIDNTLNTTSVNPVQNKVITNKVNNLEGRVTAIQGKVNSINPRADSGYVIIGDTLIQWGLGDFDYRKNDWEVSRYIYFPKHFADSNYIVSLTPSYSPILTVYYDVVLNCNQTEQIQSRCTARAFSKSGGFTTTNFPEKPIGYNWIAIGKYTA